MKIQFTRIAFALGIMSIAGLSLGTTGCGERGTPAPPEDVVAPDFEESEEYLDGERSQS